MGRVAVDYPELPLDKNYFLTDATAALYALNASAAPNDVLQKLADAVLLTGGSLKKPDNGAVTIPASSITGLSNSLISCGYYTGNAVGSSDQQYINLGFTPCAVLVFYRGVYTYSNGTTAGGLATSNAAGFDDTSRSILIQYNGFVVYQNAGKGVQANSKGEKYNYIAFNRGS